ncbi:uncharacterized protein LOC134805492 [Cydia splendana]|uniref:uncharacterized protein LOC134805492 n=1 Tax=Cydia splendana TaxID=1100963 RepID=UPI00300CF9A8
MVESYPVPRWNFQKADWPAYAAELDVCLRWIPPEPKNYERFRKLIKSIAKKHIPRGYRKNYIPCWNAETETLWNEFSETGDREVAHELIRSLDDARRMKWAQTVETMSFKHSSRKAWHTLNRLSSGDTSQKRKPKVDPNEIALRIHKLSKAPSDKLHTRKVRKKLQNLKNETLPHQDFGRPVSADEVMSAIKETSINKACGDDEIFPEFIKYCGPRTRDWIAKFYTAIIDSGTIPPPLKRAKIIAILKPGKSDDKVESYRPIALLSVIYKLLERIIYNRISSVINNSIPQEQAGFRPQRNCTDQVLALTTHIEKGSDRNMKASAVFIDLTAAYDTVWRQGLLLKLLKIVPCIKIYRLLESALSNRPYRVHLGECASQVRVLNNGLPQGSVLAPLLFNVYVHDMPETTSRKFGYADDLALVTLDSNMQAAELTLTRDLSTMDNFFTNWRLCPNPSKTEVACFHLNNKMAKKELKVKFRDTTLEHNFYPKYLGVTLDRSLNFKQHLGKVSAKLKTRNSIIQKLTRTTWGANAATLRTSALSLPAEKGFTQASKERRPRKAPRKSQCGTAEPDIASGLRAATPNTALYVSRLHVSATADDVVEYLRKNTRYELKVFQLRSRHYVHFRSFVERGILRTLASLYDPCGFAAPLILPAKLLLQELWKRKEKWDSQLPEDLEEEWQKAVSAIKTAAEIEIPRHVGLSPNEDTECELHCFTDASKRAYSAVVYLRLVNKKEKGTKVMFIMAKSRVTPINHTEDLKIPKLELLGFVIGKRLLTYVKNTLRIELKRLCLWSDSEIVLYWMKSEKLLPPFVCRRINEIKQNKDIEPRYVNTELNPADLATRPELWLTKKELWFNGPQFLSLSEEGWPKLQEHSQSALFAGTDSIMDTMEMDLSSQVEESIRGTIEQENTEGMTIDIENIEDNGQMQVSAIGVDTNCTEIKNLQKLYFPQEAAGKKTSLSRNLGLFVDMDGLLRCKGRLMNTMCSYDTKYPILIPKNSEFTDRLILETHQKYYHVGAPHILSIIRQKYWIPQGRAKVQRIIRKCQQCIKHGGGPYKLPPTPALPAERANYSAPFTYTGIDYFGPIFVTEDGHMRKRWICLYTCLAVRAIHMEVVKDLTAEECLLAMRRFISTRGKPELIVSDNALQFKLTAELLANTYFVDNKIRWKFIPQLSPWHGGFYERLVGVVKNCMKRTLEKRVLNDSQLGTVVKEIEAVANSRPLTCVGSDIEYVLRPADFLTYGKCIAIEPSIQNPHPGGTVTKENLIEGWKKGRVILEEFKRMFLGQYLCSLRERYQHSHKEPRVKTNQSPHIGDIVQIKGDSKNRENWKVGKIISLERGADGECRVAKVNVEGKEFIRSIGHLYPLEVEEATLEDPGTEERIQVNPDVRETEESSLQEIAEISEIETRCPERESTEQMPQEIAVEDDVTLETNGSDKMLTPVERVQRNGSVERANVVTEGDEEVERVETVSNPNEERMRRAAAVRARERIAQWTSQLIALL